MAANAISTEECEKNTKPGALPQKFATLSLIECMLRCLAEKRYQFKFALLIEAGYEFADFAAVSTSAACQNWTFIRTDYWTNGKEKPLSQEELFPPSVTDEFNFAKAYISGMRTANEGYKVERFVLHTNKPLHQSLKPWFAEDKESHAAKLLDEGEGGLFCLKSKLNPDARNDWKKLINSHIACSIIDSLQQTYSMDVSIDQNVRSEILQAFKTTDSLSVGQIVSMFEGIFSSNGITCANLSQLIKNVVSKEFSLADTTEFKTLSFFSKFIQSFSISCERPKVKQLEVQILDLLKTLYPDFGDAQLDLMFKCIYKDFDNWLDTGDLITLTKLYDLKSFEKDVERIAKNCRNGD